MHDSNIENIVVTLEVLKFFKFRDDRCSHSENIQSISVTLEVLKLLKSREDNKLHL